MRGSAAGRGRRRRRGLVVQRLRDADRVEAGEHRLEDGHIVGCRCLEREDVGPSGVVAGVRGDHHQRRDLIRSALFVRRGRADERAVVVVLARRGLTRLRLADPGDPRLEVGRVRDPDEQHARDVERLDERRVVRCGRDPGHHGSVVVRARRRVDVAPRGRHGDRECVRVVGECHEVSGDRVAAVPSARRPPPRSRSGRRHGGEQQAGAMARVRRVDVFITAPRSGCRSPGR